MQTGTPDRITEIIAKAWLVCDPNRGCFDPDELEAGAGLRSGSDYEGKPKWHWFVPRAEAMRDFLAEHGLVVRPRGADE